MKGKRIFVSVCVLGLLLALILWPVLAQDAAERDQPGEPLSIEAMVSSKFTYQGMLREDGAPVTGTRDMVFRLYSDDACTVLIGGDISMPGVLVDKGLFSVELSVSYTNINGQGLWLGIQIEGVTVGCQEILPVPYALSLRPGAKIIGEQANWDAIHAENTASVGSSYGIYARSYATSGRGVFGYVSVDSGQNYGVYGRSDSSEGAGVYARGLDAGADLILGGNSATTQGDDGRILSDPAYPSSDIILISNDGIRIDFDQDGDGEDADFEIHAGDDTIIFNVDESGDVTFGGAGIAAFPRPAYDTGWVALGQGATADRTHNLGGNIDNYVVDLTCKRSGGAGVNNWGVGGDANSPDYYGAWWSNLTTSAITLHRWNDDTDCPSVRSHLDVSMMGKGAAMKTIGQISVLLVLLGSLFLVSAVLAAPTAATLDHYVISGGGGRIEAGIYTLDGAIGQAVVGVDIAAPFDLCSGFWCSIEAFHIYLPLLLLLAP